MSDFEVLRKTRGAKEKKKQEETTQIAQWSDSQL